MAHLKCIDCHMPFASRGAYDARIKGYHRGDTRTHLFAISGDPNYAIDDGKKLAAGAKEDGQVRLTVEMTCYACHQSGAVEELPRGLLLEAMERVHTGP